MILKYRCGWCHHKFKAESGGTSKVGKKFLNQIQCPRCGNFLKTLGGE